MRWAGWGLARSVLLASSQMASQMAVGSPGEGWDSSKPHGTMVLLLERVWLHVMLQ